MRPDQLRDLVADSLNEKLRPFFACPGFVAFTVEEADPGQFEAIVLFNEEVSGIPNSLTVHLPDREPIQVPVTVEMSERFLLGR